MREQLQAEITELERQVTGYTDQLEQTEYGTSKHTDIKADLEKTKVELAAKQKQLETLDSMEQQKIAEKQHGLKEVIFEVFDAVIPADAGNVIFGINDFQEKGETFRQMIDLAVDENNSALNTYIAELLEAKDAKIREMNAQIIEKDAQLQEAVRKEQFASENYERALAENERLEIRIVACENVSAGKSIDIDELRDQLKAKDEQIAKLTEEINKPRFSVEVPAHAKPSVTLQQMMEEARSKKVKSSLDLALSGQVHRGKVELTIPTLGGHETPEETFLVEGNKINFADDRIPDTQVPSVGEELIPSEERPANGLVEGESSEAGSVVKREEIEARFKRIEEHLGLKSWKMDEDAAKEVA